MKRRKFKKILGGNIAFVSPEDLILSKLIWRKKSGSTRHLEDIESVITIQKKLDWRYIKRWAKLQGTEKYLKLVLKR